MDVAKGAAYFAIRASCKSLIQLLSKKCHWRKTRYGMGYMLLILLELLTFNLA